VTFAALAMLPDNAGLLKRQSVVVRVLRVKFNEAGLLLPPSAFSMTGFL
jgi:hypothetical protein